MCSKMLTLWLTSSHNSSCFKLLPYCFRPTAVYFQAQSGAFHFSFNACWYLCWQTICQGVCWFTYNFYANDAPQTTILTDHDLPTVRTLRYTTLSHSPGINLSFGFWVAHPGCLWQEAGQSRISSIVSWIWSSEHLQLLWNNWDHCYHLSTIKNMFNLITYVHPEVKPSRSSIKGHLDAAASASMLASRRIFLAKDCREWSPH